MSPQTDPRVILYIDSDEDDHFLFGSLLKTVAPDCTLQSFMRAEDALAYLQKTEQPPFLILCEVLLPGMTGLELRRTIYADEQLRKRSIPFVFVSDPVIQSVIEEAFELTVQGFFEKSHNRQQQLEDLTLILNYWQTSFHPNKV